MFYTGLFEHLVKQQYFFQIIFRTVLLNLGKNGLSAEVTAVGHRRVIKSRTVVVYLHLFRICHLFIGRNIQL